MNPSVLTAVLFQIQFVNISASWNQMEIKIDLHKIHQYIHFGIDGIASLFPLSKART